MKRCIDVVVSVGVLVLTCPVLALVALAVWLDSGSPILFRHERVGRNFQHFRILKFRTMRVQEGGPSVTVGGDGRITKIGKILRLTKVDELPQFWNVLKGEMSIVGPRPEVPEYVAMFEPRYRNILTVRPGITDFASIYYRDEEAVLAGSPDPMKEYKEHVLPAKLDFADRYIDTGNVLVDLKIIFQTAVVTVKGKPGDGAGKCSRTD